MKKNANLHLYLPVRRVELNSVASKKETYLEHETDEKNLWQRLKTPPQKIDDDEIEKEEALINHNLHQIFKETSIGKQYIELYNPSNSELYDSKDEFTSEPYLRIRWQKEDIGYDDCKKISTALGTLLNKDITLSTKVIPIKKTWVDRSTGEEISNRYAFFLENISMQDIMNLDDWQLAAGARIAENVLGPRVRTQNHNPSAER